MRRSGWKTSEFWAAVGAIVVALVLLAYHFHWLSALVPALPAFGYAMSRGITKAGTQPFPSSG